MFAILRDSEIEFFIVRIENRCRKIRHRSLNLFRFSIPQLLTKNQKDLAEKIGCSEKAVSKWENGQSFPDVTLFPRLANLFGVSVDELMNDGKNGIAIAGNIIADVVKNIDDISVCRLTSKDVVRHPLVQKIVKAYEEYETKNNRNKSKDKRRK